MALLPLGHGICICGERIFHGCFKCFNEVVNRNGILCFHLRFCLYPPIAQPVICPSFHSYQCAHSQFKERRVSTVGQKHTAYRRAKIATSLGKPKVRRCTGRTIKSITIRRLGPGDLKPTCTPQSYRDPLNSLSLLAESELLSLASTGSTLALAGPALTE